MTTWRNGDLEGKTGSTKWKKTEGNRTEGKGEGELVLNSEKMLP